MRKRQKEAILILYLKEKEKYKKLAEHILRLFWDDPSSPKECLHTITYRIKDKERLIEKIDKENKQGGTDVLPITHKNFQKRIGDLLGIRLVCLRLSDIQKVEAYLGFLADEKILKFIKKPVQKRSFILPINPGDALPEGLDLRYSGYSSIHYQVMLGKNSGADDELRQLQVEFQLRTILEEAWGEIDHKYRYVHSRSGNELPDYIHAGFYNLSAYLQAAALQAEHLCRQAEAHVLMEKRQVKGRLATSPVVEPSLHNLRPGEYDQGESLIAIHSVLEQIFGFKLSFRTLAYVLKRIDKYISVEQPHEFISNILTKKRLREFGVILHDVLDRNAFEDINNRNIDAINAVNYALSHENQGGRVAIEGLKAVLRWRKGRSTL